MRTTCAFRRTRWSRRSRARAAGATIVTDTNMALAGISKPTLAKLGGRTVCLMADEAVAREAKARGVTRATVSMEHAAKLDVLAVGLLVLAEPIDEQLLDPFVEIGRLEHVHALVGQLRRHHEIFGKNLAELRGKGHATFAVDLEMELAVEIYPCWGSSLVPSVSAVAATCSFPCCVLRGI